MALESPVDGEKIWGFGAFQQVAEFFLFYARRDLAKSGPIDAEDAQDFLKKITIMMALFDRTYVLKTSHPALLKEREAWQLLRVPMIRWRDALQAHITHTPGDLEVAARLIEEGAALMQQWGVISQSFKTKLEYQEVREEAIEVLIQDLRAKAADVVEGQ